MNIQFYISIIISIALAVVAWLLFQVQSLTPFNVSLFVLIACLIAAFIPTKVKPKGNSSPSSFADKVGNITTLYVGNLPYRANEDAVETFFKEHVFVQSVRLMKDKRTGKRKGYGFIEVATEDVNSLIEKLNDIVFQERTLKIRLAKEKIEG